MERGVADRLIPRAEDGGEENGDVTGQIPSKVEGERVVDALRPLCPLLQNI